MSRVLLVSSLVCSAALLAACQPMAARQGASGMPPAAPSAASVAPPSVQQQQQQAAQQQQQQAAPSVDFYVGQQQQAPGLNPLKLADGSLWLQPAPALTRADLSQVGPVKNAQGQAFVQFNFSQAGAQKLAAVTTRNVGKLLVVGVGGNLLAVPRISGPVTNGTLLVAMPNDQAAVNVANAILGTPAPQAAQQTQSRPQAAQTQARPPARK